MKVTHSVRYEASVEEVYAMLSDPAFREHATLAQGAVSADATVDGGSVRIDFRRHNDEVPGFARKLIGGEELHATQAEDWSDDAYEADMSITTEGIPAGIHGTRTLVEDGDGTLDTFEGESRAKIPLVGGKIEKLLAEKLVLGWNVEHRAGVAWLRGER